MIGRKHLKYPCFDAAPNVLLVIRCARRRAADAFRPLKARLGQIVSCQEQILRTGLAVNPNTARLRVLNLRHRLFARDMHDQYRYVHQFGQRDGAVCRLAFNYGWAGVAVEPRRSVAGGRKHFGQPSDAIGVLGVYHGHRTLAPR